MQSRHAHFAPTAAKLTAAVGAAFVVTIAFAAAAFPTGSYTSGGFVVTFEGGHVRVKQGKTVQVEGDYTVSGNEIKFVDKRGPWACTKAGEETGSYDWTYDNGTLTFKKVSDQCQGRIDGLGGQPWKKQ